MLSAVARSNLPAHRLIVFLFMGVLAPLINPEEPITLNIGLGVAGLRTFHSVQIMSRMSVVKYIFGRGFAIDQIGAVSALFERVLTSLTIGPGRPAFMLFSFGFPKFVCSQAGVSLEVLEASPPIPNFSIGFLRSLRSGVTVIQPAFLDKIVMVPSKPGASLTVF